jgi:hypothetical protein
MATHGRNGLRSIGSDFPPRGSGSTGRDAASPGDRKRRTIAALLLLLPLIAGCVRADFEIVLLPDGSGALRADVAYSGKKWPAFFGDPYQSFLTPQGFAGMTPPGFVAWSEPEVTVEDGWRHLETTAWFDDIRRIVFPAKRSDRTPYAALGFSGNPAAGQLRLLSELDSVLARPLPLPSPQEIGMEGVSIPETVMNGIRSQMGTILSGLDLTLRLTATGDVLRADGFDDIEDGQAVIRVDAARGAAAFQERAGVLVDWARLVAPEPGWVWEAAPADSALVRELAAGKAAARNWFGAR